MCAKRMIKIHKADVSYTLLFHTGDAVVRRPSRHTLVIGAVRALAPYRPQMLYARGLYLI